MSIADAMILLYWIGSRYELQNRWRYSNCRTGDMANNVHEDMISEDAGPLLGGHLIWQEHDWTGGITSDTSKKG